MGEGCADIRWPSSRLPGKRLMPNYCLITEAALVALCKNVARTGPNKTSDERVLRVRLCVCLCVTVSGCVCACVLQYIQCDAKAK